MKNPFKKKKIVIFVRKKDPNLGDIVIGDTCEYILNSLSGLIIRRAKIESANLFSRDENYIASKVNGNNAIVFPGGGINSNQFCSAAELILKFCDNSKEVYFNANGISKNHMSKKVTDRITAIFNDSRVKQITTRGDYDKALQLIQTEKPYPCRLVLDPAIWAKETYNIEKQKDSSIIGLGVIRPEIFEELKTGLSREDVCKMYTGIISELESRGYKYQLFCNGNQMDYDFAEEIIEKLSYDKKEYLKARPLKARELVEQISCFQGIIAARFHANIIATSLGIPSVALVWNEKMDGFSHMIGCQHRYTSDSNILMNPKMIVNLLEKAIKEGYDEKKINQYKKETIETMKNILR